MAGRNCQYNLMTAEPSLAEQARTLLSAQRFATLATHAHDSPSYPFASLVAYADDDGGGIVLLLSRLAVHTRNLEADAHASVLIAGDGSDALAQPRLTLLGTVHPIAAEESSRPRELYLERHPEAHSWISFGDFHLHRLAPERAYYVAGFGSMGWLTARELAAAPADPLVKVAPGILAHMNADHADALRQYCAAYAALDATHATMVGVDRLGMRLMAETADGRQPIRIAFPREARDSNEVRKVLIEMLRGK